MDRKRFDGVEFQSLKQARDEVKLQAHMFTAEMREQFEKVEVDWQKFMNSLRHERSALKKSIAGVRHATDPIVRDLRAAYDRISSHVRRPEM